MADMLKIAALGITGLLAALTLKKQNAESAMLVSIAAGVMILMAVMSYIDVIRRFWEDLARAVPVAGEVSGPLLKAVGISIVTKVSSELCRDGGEGALASKIELAGSAACLVAMIPLLSRVLKMILTML